MSLTLLENFFYIMAGLCLLGLFLIFLAIAFFVVWLGINLVNYEYINNLNIGG